jgi:site-specific DNA-methyltransferase (cytosine-N4-specific)
VIETICGPKTTYPAYFYEGDNLTNLRKLSDDLCAGVCITSPPYFNKFDYEHPGQYGLEANVQSYLDKQVAVFHEVNRLMVEGGTCFIVIGDTSNNYSPVRCKSQRKGGDKQWLFRRKLQDHYREKEILSVPLRLIEALRQDGWIHRNTLIWDKGHSAVVPNSDTAPETHEYILHLIKWSFKKRPYGNTTPLKSSVLHHHASMHPVHGCVFPPSLVFELLSVCPDQATIIDPYVGSGTTAICAKEKGVFHGFDLDCSIVAEIFPNSVISRESDD